MEEAAKYEQILSLLIVEDDQSQLRTLTAIMEEEGFDVIGCSAASEALEHLGRLETGVVVLDLCLPDLSGTQLLEKLATATERIRVVINTAYSSFESAKDALNLGAFAYVEKAGDPDELLRHVHRAFEASLRSYADQLETAVAERTRELRQANELLRQEVTDRKRAEEEIRLFSRAIAGAIDAIGITDMKGIFTYANPAMEKTFGYKKGELIGKHVSVLNLNSEITEQILSALIKTGSWNGEVLQQKKNKEIFPALLSLSTVRDEKGNTVATMGAVRDITKRKKAEEKLRLYSEITVNMSEGVYAIRAGDGVIVYTNPKFEEMFGYGPGELIGKHVSVVNAPTEKSPEETAKEIVEVLNKNGVWRGEICNIKKDGTLFWCYASVSGFEDTQHGRVWVTVHTDITERKKAEEEARRHQLELAHISRLGTIGQMASELAHELNQPLCATLTHLEGCLRMVKSGSSDTDKVLKKLETATRQIDQAGAIVSRVKGFAMKGKIKRSTVFVNDIVREATSFSEMEMRHNHITTELNLGQKIQPVLANPIQIEQVILNLIQNAVEAMKDIPKKHRKLIISTTMLDDAVEVAVKDAGKGIDEGNAENIFESFVTTKSEGLGIGLSISQSIVESHGGRIYFKDNSDHGVAFCFTLPLPLKAEKV